jgi:6-phosphogluconolactonase
MDNPNPEQQRRARRSSLQLPAAERRALKGRMRSIAGYLLIIAVGVNLFPPILSAQGLTNQRHVVFVMTNSAVRNEVIAYESSSNGGFAEAGHFDTGGRGSGGVRSPLQNQGSLTFSQDHSLLFALSAGSGELSVFRVNGASLSLVDKKPTGGANPVSVAQRQDVVYVLNQGGSGAVVGFKLDGTGHLTNIPKSTAFLSSSFAFGQDVSISPNGQFVVVIELVSDNIDTFRIQPDGTLLFNLNPGSATIGVFAIQSDGTLSTLTPIQIVPSSNTAVSGIAAS